MKNIALFILVGLLVATAVGCDNVEDAGHDVVDTVKDAVNQLKL